MNADLIKKWKSLSFEYGYSSSWGALHIFSSEKTSEMESLVKDQVKAFYHSQGLIESDWSTYLNSNLESEEYTARMKRVFPDLASLNLTLFEGQKLDSDDVFIFKQSTPGWLAVMSLQLEWTLPGANSLALELSKNHDVLSTTFIEGAYTELSLYRDGKVHSQFLQGPSLGASNNDSFDWNWFEGKGNVVPAGELAKETSELEHLLDLAGPDVRGYRDSLSAAPIYDYGPESYFVFRKQALPTD